MKKCLHGSKLILLLVVILLFTGIDKLYAQVSKADSLILIKLYDDTNGDNWTNKTNWKTNPDLSTWYGITVVSNQIITIDLGKNNLQGTIPTELGNLVSLQYLKLDTNRITGNIPVELGKLASLEQFYLGGNQLTGSIPVELANLTLLRWLNLSDNQLIGTIPAVLNQLTQLEYLQLSVNNLSGSIPAGLANLANLKWLNLGGNQLTGNIPVELGQLTNLEQLYLNSNQLTDSIPIELGQLTSLIWLSLEKNMLSGPIPAELKNMTNLELLRLNENLFTAIPAELAQLPALKWFELYSNKLTGQIPVEFWSMKGIQLLSFGANQFTGTIPNDLTAADSLKWVFLNNNLFDTLPDLSLPTKFNFITVSDNKLTFSDLEQNMDLTNVYFIYAPQDSIDVRQSVTKNLAENYTYTLVTGGTQNNYQWYKDGQILTTQTSATLTLNNLALTDAGVYNCWVTNTLAPDLTLVSRNLTLSVVNISGNITVNLDQGWNIFSSPVMPDDKNLMNILQPLIDAEQLKKVMNEKGETIEDFGVFGGWKNFIGDIEETEGYKINVSAPASINLTGTLTQLPGNIPLTKGWNIISWPSMTEQDGQVVFQALIDGGYLKKVMNEKGQSIEDYGTFGGWVNNIGNFKPGEGYKVNVNADCMLNVTESPIKSVQVVTDVLAVTHFIAYKGNGIDHMNINLVNLSPGFIEGDEIGVFDGDICVGSARIQNHQAMFGNRLSSISIPVSASDELNEVSNGFIPGNQIILKLYRDGKEYSVAIQPVTNVVSRFEKNSSIFAKASVDLNTGIELPESNYSVVCYPNPFDTYVNIEIDLLKRADVTVEIYDLLSRTVCQLYKGTAEQKLTLQWDGNDSRGNRAAPGVYICRVNNNFQKVVLNGR